MSLTGLVVQGLEDFTMSLGQMEKLREDEEPTAEVRAPDASHGLGRYHAAELREEDEPSGETAPHDAI